MGFTVLYVCTGNICRSPTGERLLAARIRPATDIVVTSAGTGALDGWPMDPPSATALKELGGDESGHAARSVSEPIVDGADLVLCATRDHRARVLALVPAAIGRTFTMREFARLGALLAPGARTPAETVVAVAALRGVADPVLAFEDDIGDPFQASMDAIRRCAGEISITVDATINALGI